MQALILAAGRGSRLGGKNNGVCKCLLKVGRRPLIEHQLEALAEAGIGPVGMVVGYASSEVREDVGIKAEFIENPRWKVTNSLYSFFLAREWVQGDVVVLNCDILFGAEMLDRLLSVQGDALLYDSSAGDGREEMSVRVENGYLVDMRKDMPAQEVSGENVGVIRFTADTAAAVFRKAEELLAAGREKEWIGSAVREVARDRKIRAVDVAGLPWAEIDFPYDLYQARKRTWPAIQKSRRRRGRTWKALRWASLSLLLLLGCDYVYRVWVHPAEAVWESLPPTGVEQIALRGNGATRHWSLLEPDLSAIAEVEGPGEARVDVRPLFPHAPDGEARYVIEVEVDGEQKEWYAMSGGVSQAWEHPNWVVGKRGRISVDIPPGAHEIRVRLVATDNGPCAVRIRQSITDTPE